MLPNLPSFSLEARQRRVVFAREAVLNRVIQLGIAVPLSKPARWSAARVFVPPRAAALYAEPDLTRT